MIRGAAALALAALIGTGCDRQAAAPSPIASETGHTAPSAAAPPVDAPASLVGEWRVAGIDGAPIDAPIGIALSIDAGTMTFDPRCDGFTWDYDYRAGRLATARRNPGAVCAIDQDPALNRLAAALDAVEGAARTPANAIELRGGGRSVTLFSQ